VICDFADVVVVPFPFVDIPISKHRPALVLSTRAFNGDNGQTILAMITTGAGSSWPSDVSITDSDSAGLKHHSLVRWKVFTVQNILIVQKVGSMGEDDRREVSRALSAILPDAPTRD
jgi:mRNA-degrading endonuclease toxin of MazEF toxin-antitoxin module